MNHIKLYRYGTKIPSMVPMLLDSAAEETPVRFTEYMGTVIAECGPYFDEPVKRWGCVAGIFHRDPRSKVPLGDMMSWAQWTCSSDDEDSLIYTVNAAGKIAAILQVSENEDYSYSSMLQMRHSADYGSEWGSNSGPGDIAFDSIFGLHANPNTQRGVKRDDLSLYVFPWGGAVLRRFMLSNGSQLWVLVGVSGFTQEDDDFVARSGARKAAEIWCEKHLYEISIDRLLPPDE